MRKFIVLSAFILCLSLTGACSNSAGPSASESSLAASSSTTHVTVPEKAIFETNFSNRFNQKGFAFTYPKELELKEEDNVITLTSLKPTITISIVHQTDNGVTISEYQEEFAGAWDQTDEMNINGKNAVRGMSSSEKGISITYAIEGNENSIIMFEAFVEGPDYVELVDQIAATFISEGENMSPGTSTQMTTATS